MLKSRLSCPHSHFDGTCNPESPTHWFKKFLDSDADIYCQAYTIDDNPTLPAQFVADLKKEYTGTVYYNRFILGQWMAANGVIYRLLADSLAAGDGRFLALSIRATISSLRVLTCSRRLPSISATDGDRISSKMSLSRRPGSYPGTSGK